MSKPLPIPYPFAEKPGMRIPDVELCLRLMEETRMWPNIYRHSRVVTDVARLLAGELNRIGERLNMALVLAGALLHDITKTRSIVTHEHHARTGEEMIRDLGYPEVAYVVGQHVHMDPEHLKQPFVSEAELVFYADKRVRHETVVSLMDRYSDLEHRYAKTSEHRNRIRENLQFAQDLEAKIFLSLPFTPHEMETKLRATY